MKVLFQFLLLMAICCSSFAHEGRSNKDSSRHYFELGANAEAVRKYNDAWLYYEKATRFDPSDTAAFSRLANVCFSINKIPAAIGALEALSNLNPNDYPLQWRLIRIYYNNGQYAKVISLLPSLRKHFTETPGWNFMLGKSYYLLPNPDYDRAVEHLKLSLKEDRPHAEAAYLIARLLVKMEHYEASVPYYELSFSLDSIPKPNHQYELAQILFTARKPKEAVAYFRRAKESGYPQSDNFDQNYAIALADAGQADSAVRILEEMLVRRERDKGIITLLADICYQSGRFRQSISYWERLLDIDPKDARVWYQIGKCHINLGNERYGKALCNKAIEMDPSLQLLRQKKELF